MAVFPVLIYNEKTNEPEYEIPAPYMYDADGEESFDVFYNIETTNGDYYLTVFADSNWINAEDRIFPVTIDPSYTKPDNLSIDTYINEDAADEPRGSYNFFYVGENEVAYIGVPTPELPIGATLEYAALAAYYYYKAKVNYGSVQITAHKVTGFNWYESSLTWNDVVARDPVNFGLSTAVLGADNDNAGVVTAYGNIGAYASTPVLTAFDITDAAQSWLNGSPNYGIGLRYVITSPNRSVQFRSTEGPAAHRPMAQYQYSVTPLYEATVNSYYDNGYSVYYGEEHIQSASKIRDYLAAVNNRYMELFGLHLNFSTINYYNSPLDNCKGTVTSGNVGNLCTCGLEHSHLDNVSWFFSHTYSGNNTTTNVYWTCHNIISEGADGSIDYNRSYSKGTSVYLLELCDSSDRERLSRGVLMHELNHQFGARDHYHELADPDDSGSCIHKDICSECGVNKRPESCIMYNSGLGINNDNILCEACQEDILNHLKGHH